MYVNDNSPLRYVYTYGNRCRTRDASDNILTSYTVLGCMRCLRAMATFVSSRQVVAVKHQGK